MPYQLPYTMQAMNGEKLTIQNRLFKDGIAYLEGYNEVQPGAGPPMHVHHKQDECFTVIAGKMGYQVAGEQPKFAEEGETIMFKAGVPHKFWNAGQTILHCKGVLTPEGNIIYFLSEIFKSVNENGGRPSAWDAAFLLSRYKSEFDMLEIPAVVRKFIFPILYRIGKLSGRYSKYKNAPQPI